MRCLTINEGHRSSSESDQFRIRVCACRYNQLLTVTLHWNEGRILYLGLCLQYTLSQALNDDNMQEKKNIERLTVNRQLSHMKEMGNIDLQQS